VTLADRPLPAPPSAGTGRRISCLLVLLLLVAGTAGAGVWLLNRPRLRFSNRLAAPVRLVLGEDARTVAPGQTAVLTVPRGTTLVAEWSLVRPISADGQPMGEPIEGSLVLRGPRGTVSDSADTVDGSTNYFAPLITNGTGEPLRVTVNAGLAGALDCGCAVRPGSRRVFIGYYRLYGNSTVEARGSAGVAVFRDLGAQVTSRNGTVGLRFAPGDLRPRPVPPVSAR
jgi:hypothetical protein